MIIEVENTDKVVELVTYDGYVVPARIWEGKTLTGIPVHVYITRIAVAEGQPAHVYEQFERELEATRAPSPEAAAIPLRLIL